MIRGVDIIQNVTNNHENLNILHGHNNDLSNDEVDVDAL